MSLTLPNKPTFHGVITHNSHGFYDYWLFSKRVDWGSLVYLRNKHPDALYVERLDQPLRVVR